MHPIFFKGWAGNQAEMNTPLVIGQHGGFYGMNMFSSFEHDIKIADKYFSWGWDDKERKNKAYWQYQMF